MENGGGKRARKERWEHARRTCEGLADAADTLRSAFGELEIAQDFAHLRIEDAWGEDALDKIIQRLAAESTSSFELKHRRRLAKGAPCKRRSALVEQRAA